MFEKFAGPARAAVEDARFEAARSGDRQIGTEHLLVALLENEDLADLVGFDADSVRRAAQEADRAALAAIGLPGIADIDRPGAAPAAAPRRMTPGAIKVLQQTLLHAKDERARQISSRHLLLAVLECREPDPAATLLASLPVDLAQARARLADRS